MNSLKSMFLVLVSIVTTSPCKAQDPHSLVDHLKGIGSASDFVSRRLLYEKLYGASEYYRGTQQQNTQMLGQLKFQQLMAEKDELTLSELDRSVSFGRKTRSDVDRFDLFLNLDDRLGDHGNQFEPRSTLRTERFVPNGCGSARTAWLVPDFDFGEACCDPHDYDYFRGGTEQDRYAADLRFRDCIREKGHPIRAEIYYHAVRQLGRSHFAYSPQNPDLDKGFGNLFEE